MVKGNANFVKTLVGKRLSLALEYTGNSPEQVANFVERSERTVYRYLVGEIQIPDSVVPALCGVLGVSRSFLLRGHPVNDVDFKLIHTIFPGITSIGDRKVSSSDTNMSTGDTYVSDTDIHTKNGGPSSEFIFQEDEKKGTKIVKIEISIKIINDQ